MADRKEDEEDEMSDHDEDSRKFRNANASTSNDSKKEICRNFLKNRCKFQNCKYEHPKSATATATATRENRSRSRSPVSTKDDAKKDICRDFLRNLCKRGDHCRFYHPPREEGEGKKAWFTLCLDYQNGKCTRPDCRYFHVSLDDEERFRGLGEISPHIIDQAMAKATSLDIAFGGTKPTCKDFLRGFCRLRICRFRHVNLPDYEEEIYNALFHELEKLLGPPVRPGRGSLNYGPRRRGPYGDDYGCDPFEYGMERPAPPYAPRDMSTDYALDTPLPPPIRRSYYGDGYDMPMRAPLEASAPWDERDVRPQFRDEPGMAFDYSESEKEIMLLRREIKQLREHALYSQQGKVDQSSFDEIKISNDKFIRENSELHDKVRQLMRENEKLNSSVRTMENFSTKNDEMKLQLEKYQRENADLVEQGNQQKSQIYNLQREQQSFDRYQTYMQDQARKLQNQLLVVENELAQSWGGGPPTIPSLREAWALLKNNCNFLVKNSMMTGIGDEAGYLGGGTNGTETLNSGFGRSNFNPGPIGYDGANAQPLNRNFDAAYDGQAYRNFSRR